MSLVSKVCMNIIVKFPLVDKKQIQIILSVIRFKINDIEIKMFVYVN
jgi:hypothetical protein